MIPKSQLSKFILLSDEAIDGLKVDESVLMATLCHILFSSWASSQKILEKGFHLCVLVLPKHILQTGMQTQKWQMSGEI